MARYDNSDTFTKDLAHDLNGGIGLDNSELEVLVVSRAVDDGDIYATAVVTTVPEESNVHKITDAFARTKSKVTESIHSFSDSVKTKANHVSHDVKVKAEVAREEIKKSVVTVNAKVKANPYLYAAGAVGVGFVLGRMLMSYRAKQEKKAWPEFQAGRGSPSDHTGVHLRPEKTYASGSGI